MVAVAIIAVVFTALAVAVAYGASKGSFRGVARAVMTTSRSGSRLLNSTLAVVYIGFGICVPLLFIFGNYDKSNAQVGPIKLTASMQVGRELFGEHCAVCHMLAADNAVGKTGPDLDTLKPSEAIVLHTVANGCLQKPTVVGSGTTCLGFGTMPADIVQGRQAQDIAAFVSGVAGHP
jgi:hypothetical protein